jgi:hypothetical protein
MLPVIEQPVAPSRNRSVPAGKEPASGRTGLILGLKIYRDHEYDIFTAKRDSRSDARFCPFRLWKRLPRL